MMRRLHRQLVRVDLLHFISTSVPSLLRFRPDSLVMRVVRIRTGLNTRRFWRITYYFSSLGPLRRRRSQRRRRGKRPLRILRVGAGNPRPFSTHLDDDPSGWWTGDCGYLYRYRSGRRDAVETDLRLDPSPSPDRDSTAWRLPRVEVLPDRGGHLGGFLSPRPGFSQQHSSATAPVSIAHHQPPAEPGRQSAVARGDERRYPRLMFSSH